jgi:ketosteroid isomerase-like protein
MTAELIRRALEFARDPSADFRDDALAEVYSPDVVMDMSARVFNPMLYRGYDGLRQYRDDLYETWDEVTFDAEELIEAGEDTLVISRFRGRGRGSGVPIDERGAGIWTVRDGRVVCHRFLGPIGRDEALGLLRSQSGR